MSKKDGEKDLQPSAQRPCFICGNDTFNWGIPVAGKNHPGDFVYFRPDNKSWEDGDIVLVARECTECENVQLFTYSG